MNTKINFFCAAIFLSMVTFAQAAVESSSGELFYKSKSDIKKPETVAEGEEFKRRKEATEKEAERAQLRIIENQEILRNEEKTITKERRDSLIEALQHDRAIQEAASTAQAMVQLPEVQLFLPKLYEQPLPNDMNFQLKNVDGSLQETIKSNDLAQLNIFEGQLDAYLRSDLAKQINSKSGQQEKLKIIQDNKIILERAQEAMRIKLLLLEKAKISDAEKIKYKQKISNILAKTTYQLLEINKLSLEMNAQHITVSFLSKLVATIKRLFNTYFDSSKPAALQLSVAQQKNVIDQITNGIQPFVVINAAVKEASQLVSSLPDDVLRSMGVAQLESLQQQLSEHNTLLSQLEQKISPQAVTLLNQATDNLLVIRDQLIAKVERYPEYRKFGQREVIKYDTLFEKQLVVYQRELRNSLFKPDQMYEALGLPSANAATITQDQITQAYALQRTSTAAEGGDTTWQAGRNASTILTEPYARATYDAFLADYQLLQANGVDLSQPLTDNARALLRQKGQLEKLALTKEQYDITQQLLFQVSDQREEIAELNRNINEAGKPITLIGNTRGEINTATEKIDDLLGEKKQAVQTTFQPPPE